jgi:hypothetical protein
MRFQVKTRETLPGAMHDAARPFILLDTGRNLIKGRYATRRAALAAARGAEAYAKG